MESIPKLPTSAINSIFSQIAGTESKDTWMRSADVTKQLSVSPSYEKVGGIKSEKLYEHTKLS
jgi:hypothetical protein